MGGTCEELHSTDLLKLPVDVGLQRLHQSTAALVKKNSDCSSTPLHSDSEANFLTSKFYFELFIAVSMKEQKAAMIFTVFMLVALHNPGLQHLLERLMSTTLQLAS